MNDAVFEGPGRIFGYTEVEISPVVQRTGDSARRLDVNDVPRCVSSKKNLANYS
jgi:hypothetical protein